MGKFVRAVVAWVVLFEWLAARRGWRGLSWSGGAGGRPLVLASGLGLLASLYGRWGRVALAAPVGLAAQAALASLRSQGMTPLTRMRAGSYPAYTIERVEIALEGGVMPALHVVPLGGAQKAACVIHGSGCDKTFYAWPLMDRLLRAGCAVLLVDMDGHGENTRPQRFPGILDDPRAGVAWLRERYERVGLLGISLGGCVSARAVADGLAVDRLAVLESPPKLQFGRPDMWREASALPRLGLLYLFEEITAYNLIRAWKASPIRAEISTWDLIDQLDLLGSLGRIQVPLLLLYGADDSIVKPWQALQVKQAKPAHAQFALVAGAAHVTLQLMPEALDHVEAWFRTL
ncbi:alpha/beta fold hydrolase [Chloroflexia bacterium SDU3-3]|nr:alpha/beta fold hydrolase [Chloroflexia bacterium SDU3-3]